MSLRTLPPSVHTQIPSASTDYVPAVHRLVVLRLLRQLASVYRVMKIDRFLALTPAGTTLRTVEQLVVAALANNEVRAVGMAFV